MKYGIAFKVQWECRRNPQGLVCEAHTPQGVEETGLGCSPTLS